MRERFRPSRYQLWLAVVAAAVLTTYVARRPFLQAIGRFMVTSSAFAQADVAIMMQSDHLEAELELADLYASQVVPHVGFVARRPTDAESELQRRGVVVGGTRQRLADLGIPVERIVQIPVGEGGTNEAGAAVAAWCRQAGVRRAILVTAADHSRRTLRVLRRLTDSPVPAFTIRSPRHDPFRANDWWTDRTTLRSGLIELQKLWLDYVTHPQR